MTSKDVPKYRDLIQPTFTALKELGCSGRNGEILDQVVKDLQLPDEMLDVKYPSGSVTVISDRVAWARLYLKKAGIVENSERGVWAIRSDFTDTETIDVDSLVSTVNKMSSKKPTEDPIAEEDEPESNPNEAWRDEALQVLQTMDFFGFERLCRRILRESGFADVEVTKKTGDKGIDGTGRLEIGGIFSLSVAFQCKRYKGSVGSSEIRDFRGSLTTDIEKAVFITTGTFTQAAKDEAATPGKIRIDLIDGEKLIDLLAQFEIGLKPVPCYEVDHEFFDKI